MKSLLLCTKQLYLPDPYRIYFHYLEWLLNVKVFYHIISHVLKYVQVHLPYISYIRDLLAFYVNKYTHILRSVQPIQTHVTEHTQHETEWTSYFLTKEGTTTIIAPDPTIIRNRDNTTLPHHYLSATHESRALYTCTTSPLLPTNSWHLPRQPTTVHETLWRKK